MADFSKTGQSKVLILRLPTGKVINFLAVMYECTYGSPAGGLGLPPNTEVIRRMNVDLPQPAHQMKSVGILCVLKTP